ncbi:hypothetical protein ACFP81_08100 [Deinococcus lacus]|uniref:Lipoprotein n=1 Tax=Deinococcus lacus TaxID=392561 RepID=A0ABW1YEV8_9DEIO
MQKVHLLGLVALFLVSCGQSSNGLPNGDVSGEIRGTAPGEGTLKMTAQGIGLGGIVAANVPQVTGTFVKTGYVISLPAVTETSAVEVFAYRDRNGNGRYDLTEPRTSGRNFVYLKRGSVVSSLAGLQPGWNLMDGLRVVQSGAPFIGVHLTW